MTNFFKQHMQEVKEAICEITRMNPQLPITVKRIRNYHHIPASNRSKISFYWRFLKHLEKHDILTCVHINSSKNYKLEDREKTLLLIP